MNLQDIASASAMIKEQLEPLAQKIGQGAEYTFKLFVKQVYVNAFTDLLWIVPGTLSLYFAPKIWRSARKQSKRDPYSYYEFTYTGSILLTISGIVMILVPVSGIIGVVINPEFQAIKLIIDTFNTK